MTVVLATGLTGFLGSHVAKRLHDHDVVVHGLTTRDPGTLSPHLRWHRADLLADANMEELCRSIGAQSLLHLAWYTEHPAFWSSPLNQQWYTASRQLVGSFLQAGGTRVVAAGSCAEYAMPVNGLAAEQASLTSSSPYAAAKTALSRELFEIAAKSGVSAAWGRLFFLYGPSDAPGKLIQHAAREVRSGRSLSPRDPDRRVDYIHVEDAADAFVKLLLSALNGPINIASGDSYTVGELVRVVESVAKGGSVATPPTAPVRPYTDDLVADVRRLHDELGFSPRFGIVDGVRDALANVS
jgi:nucleoside-diphosphate-sugar epimerase